MSNAVLLYATAPDVETARAIAAALLMGRCAACVNILGPIESVYRWNGAVETSSEWAFLVKTTEDAAPAARQTIIDRHPYVTPAVIGLEVAPGASNPAFLDWLRAETI